MKLREMKSRRTRDTIPEKGREGSIKSEDEIRNISSAKTSRQGVAFRSFDGVEQKGAKGGGLHYVLKGCRFKSKRIGIVNNETEVPGNGS